MSTIIDLCTRLIFTKADQVGYNEVLSRGNILENQFEVYHKPIIVDTISRFNPDYGGLIGVVYD